MKQTPEYKHLRTPWGENLPETPWEVYPRPQMKRDSFLSLNGAWEFSAEGVLENGRITVPFAPESLLSGIHGDMGKTPKLHYVKRFSLPEGFVKERVLLHFGAVDQIARVTLNGVFVGEHRGGYEAFSFDVTELLEKENRLEVDVADELESHVLPWGKQKRNRGGMWYTPVSGIWQTVWLESVPTEYVEGLRIEVGLDFAKIKAYGVQNGEITVTTPEGEIKASLQNGEALIKVENPHLWSPEDPYLYRFKLASGADLVESYFALRTLKIADVDGFSRICLNEKPYFFHGLLDQGYFSDGIYTPASPEAYEFDILSMKKLGFNTLRKHIKIEPEQFYYDCDRLGMIVFQDMINNGGYSFLRDTALPTVGMKRLNDKLLHRDKTTRTAFEDAMEKTVNQLFNHPCICYWTIFNEGWGQFESAEMYERMKKLDTSRIIDTASGWFAGAPSDVESLHVYFKPVRMKGAKKPIILSEFGGYSYKPEGHVFNPYKTYGYRFFKERADFEDALIKLYEEEIVPAVEKGLCGAIYTQVSDVEDETNGLLSYDRRVLKVSEERMRTIAQKLRIRE